MEGDVHKSRHLTLHHYSMPWICVRCVCLCLSTGRVMEQRNIGPQPDICPRTFASPENYHRGHPPLGW